MLREIHVSGITREDQGASRGISEGERMDLEELLAKEKIRVIWLDQKQ